MDQSYWDLSSILADSVRLPCHFAIDVPGLGHVIGTNQATSQHASGGDGLLVEKKSRVDLPFWMAELLALHNVVDLSFPRQYSPRVRNALDAQAKSVRLRDLNGWWYAVGIRLSSLYVCSSNKCPSCSNCNISPSLTRIEAKDLVEVLTRVSIFESCH